MQINSKKKKSGKRGSLSGSATVHSPTSFLTIVELSSTEEDDILSFGCRGNACQNVTSIAGLVFSWDF